MQDSNLELMEKAPVPRAILKLAVPTVLSTIVSLLYNLTDTYFIGLLDDAVQLGAISLAFPVFIVVQAVGNIFGNGAPPYISRCLGAKRYGEVKHTSAVSVYSAVLATLVMTGLYFLLHAPILGALGTDAETLLPTQGYLDIIVGFSFVLTLQVVLPHFLRSEGRIKEAVAGTVIGTVLNIILDPIFILVLGQGVAGAAWATILGNAAAVIYFLVIYLKGKTLLSIRPRDFKPSRRIFSEVLKMGVPSSISQIFMSISNILLNNLAVTYGNFVISGYGVAGKLISMVYMVTVGYVSGYMPFAGYNIGARNIKRMMSGFKFTLITSTAGCLVLLVPYLLLSGPFVSAFTPDPDIIRTGTMFLNRWAFALPLLGIQLTMMCTFQATGKAVYALIVNLGRQCLYYIPLLYLLNSLFQLPGLMTAQPAADILTTITAVLLGINLLRKLHREDLAERQREA